MKSRVCTLMYHDVYVNEKSESGFNFESAYSYKIDCVQFEKQIKAIRNYIDTNHIEQNYIRFSFDDGGSSFYSTIAPILEKYSFQGLFFVATQFVGKSGFLTEKQISELEKHGHIVGAHSHTHRQRMNMLPYNDLFDDWRQSVEVLNRILGHPISIASLPNGFCSNNMIMILAQLGIKEIYTSEPFESIKQKNGAEIYGRYGIKDGMSANVVLKIAFNKFMKLKIGVRKTALKFLKIIMGDSYVSIREKIYTKK